MPHPLGYFDNITIITVVNGREMLDLEFHHAIVDDLKSGIREMVEAGYARRQEIASVLDLQYTVIESSDSRPVNPREFPAGVPRT